MAALLIHHADFQIFTVDPASDGWTNLPEGIRRISQSRKISIGVLLDSIMFKAETKIEKEAVTKVEENGVKGRQGRQGHTPLVERQMFDSSTDATDSESSEDDSDVKGSNSQVQIYLVTEHSPLSDWLKGSIILSGEWGAVGGNYEHFDYSGGGDNDPDDDDDDRLDEDCGDDHQTSDSSSNDDDDRDEPNDDNYEDEGNEVEQDPTYWRYMFPKDDSLGGKDSGFYWQRYAGIDDDSYVEKHRQYLRCEKDHVYQYRGATYVCFEAKPEHRPGDRDFYIAIHESRLENGETDNQIACPPYWPEDKSGPGGEPIWDWDVESDIPWHIQLGKRESERAKENQREPSEFRRPEQESVEGRLRARPRPRIAAAEEGTSSSAAAEEGTSSSAAAPRDEEGTCSSAAAPRDEEGICSSAAAPRDEEGSKGKAPCDD